MAPDTSPTIKNQGTKLAIYLDSLTAETGALRLIPGSHRPPLHDEITRLRDNGMLEDGASVPAYAAEVQPGDVVAFNWPTWHASFGGRPDRRMCTVDFFSVANDADDIRTQMRNNAAMHRRAWGHRDGFPYYDPTWIENADHDPRRQVLIDRMRALGLFEAVTAGEASVEPATGR